MTISERLANGARLLDLIEVHRRQRQQPDLGANVERMIIERELFELELDLVAEPVVLRRQQ